MLTQTLFSSWQQLRPEIILLNFINALVRALSERVVKIVVTEFLIIRILAVSG